MGPKVNATASHRENEPQAITQKTSDSANRRRSRSNQIGRAGLNSPNEIVANSDLVGQHLGQASIVDHLQHALHHLSMANENELAKQVLLRIIDLQSPT